MTRCVRYMCRYVRQHKCYICGLCVWLLFTYVFISEPVIDESKTYIPHRRLIKHIAVPNNTCNCTCENGPKYHQSKDPSPKPRGRVGFKYSAQAFVTRAKSDPLFLERLLNQHFLHKDSKEVIRCFLTDTRFPGFQNGLNETVKLQTNHNLLSDTIVFMHIQKTGGWYFNNRLKKLKLPFPCDCRIIPCTCRPSNGSVWMYSWVMTGWKCGLHADWTQMHRCMPDMIDKLENKHRTRRYFYITQLRSPIERYLSEWNHQNSGNHWQDATLGCGRGVADWMDVRPCFIGLSWKGVSLDDFMACPHNLATNRQARMIADLNLTNCYRFYSDKEMKIKRAHAWVQSAIYNLKHMEHFGLMEDQMSSDKLFKRTFGLQLDTDVNLYKPNSKSITELQFMRILRLVELDIHVYMFAKELFYKRVKELL